MSKNFKVKNGLEVTTNVTASGDISSSGTITMLTASIGGGIFTSASLAAGGGGGGGSMDNFTLTADGGSNQTIADGNTLDIAGGDGITTAVGATDTVTVNVDASQDGHISSILTTDLKLGEDAQTKIDFETNNEIHFDVNNAELFNMTGNQLSGSGVSTGSFGRLDATSLPNIGYANFTGSVGIGTTSPNEKLEVIGNISASGDITANELNLTGSSAGMTIFNTSGTEILFNKTTGHAANITSQDAMFLLAGASKNMFFGANNVNSQVVLNDGNLSIGAGNSPAQKLVVHGDAHITGSISGSAASTGSFGRVDATSLPNIGYANFTGSVGIGTTSPGEKLEVVGNISASGNIIGELTGKGGAVTGITSLLATDIKIGEDDETKIDFEDANTINFYANNAKEVVLAENSLSPGTSNGTALGTTSLQWSDLFLASGGVINFNNGDATITGDGSNLDIVHNQGSFEGGMRLTTLGDIIFANVTDGNLNFGTDVKLFISASGGNVGIGDNVLTPGEKLTVHGNISSSGTITGLSASFQSADINGGTIDGITSLTVANNIDIGSHGFRALQLQDDSLTNTRVVFAGSNGVLSDNSKFTFASNKLSIPSLNVSQSAGIGISIEQPTTALVTARFDSDRFRFWAGGSERLTILSASGHVGIGNASPAKELTVNGEISASGNITTPSTGSVGNLIATTIEGTLSDSSRTDINSILATDLVLGEDAQTKIDFGTANIIKFFANNSEKMTISDTGVVIDGDITAQQYIVNSTVTNVTQSFSSGSTIFGDTPADDTHQFTGSVSISGSDGLDVIGSITASGNISASGDVEGATLTGTLATAAQGNITSLGTLTTLTVDDITINASTISDPGLFTLDVGGDIIIDAAGETISFKDNGANRIVFNIDTTPEIDVTGDFTIDGSGDIKLDSATNIVDVVGNITASGDISASGTMTMLTGSAGNLIATTLEGTLADSSRTDINSILATDLVLGEDAQTKIDFETANEIHFDINNSELFNMTGNELSGSDSSTGSFASLNVRGTVQDNLTIDGTLFATQKSFLIPRPEGGKLEYGVLEGQQNDVFFRGELKGDNVIYLPQEWEWLVDENTITVQLTSIGKHQELFVKEIKDNKIFIHVNGAFKTKQDIHCYHIIHGTRKDIELIRNYQW